MDSQSVDLYAYIVYRFVTIFNWMQFGQYKFFYIYLLFEFLVIIHISDISETSAVIMYRYLFKRLRYKIWASL